VRRGLKKGIQVVWFMKTRPHRSSMGQSYDNLKIVSLIRNYDNIPFGNLGKHVLSGLLLVDQIREACANQAGFCLSQARTVSSFLGKTPEAQDLMLAERGGLLRRHPSVISQRDRLLWKRPKCSIKQKLNGGFISAFHICFFVFF
jgi:hypothetical protein